MFSRFNRGHGTDNGSGHSGGFGFKLTRDQDEQVVSGLANLGFLNSGAARSGSLAPRANPPPVSYQNSASFPEKGTLQ